MNIEKMTFEQACEQVTTIVEKLEKGELPLEESISLYTEAMTLTAHAQKLLTKAETDVKTLLEKEEKFELKTVDIDEEHR